MRILEAIREGGCPQLKGLNLSDCMMTEGGGRILGEALRNGKLQELDQLALSFNHDLGDSGVLPIVLAIEEGGCPHLKDLEVTANGMGGQGATSFANAMNAGRMMTIEDIFLSEDANYQLQPLGDMLRAVGLGKCPKLQYLFASLGASDEETGEYKAKSKGRKSQTDSLFSPASKLPPTHLISPFDFLFLLLLLVPLQCHSSRSLIE